MAKLKLCYVEDLGLGMYYVLFFSKKNTKDVWGDDWDDVPYEHNASEPYEYDKKIIVEQGNTIITPCSEYNNSPYSVEDINNKAVPWIYFKYDTKDTIFANDEYDKVVEILRKNKCKIYETV